VSSSSSIDLAKGKSNLSDDIIRWALGFGRLLIIIVEIVAFSAFIYRFVLDRELIDLNDKIKAEEAIVRSLKESEAEYRNLQQRIADAKTITNTGNTKVNIFNDVISLTPSEITYQNFTVEDDILRISVNISTIPSLTTYVKALQEYEQVASVVVTGIDNSSGTNTVSVELVARLNGETK
jgi:hypothetical protein